MNKLTLSILLVLFFFLTSVAGATEEEIKASCIEKTTNSCLVQCQKTQKIHCSEACTENAKNQCRQAGE